MNYKELEQEWKDAASDSPDSTKTAAVLFNIKLHIIYASACNDLPEGHYSFVKDYKPRLTRPKKYNWINHAERRLIAYCARHGIRTLLHGLYMHWFPCAECAKSIIDAGIVKLICDKPELEGEVAEFWHFKEALQMLTEAGVEIEYHAASHQDIP